MSDPDYSPEYQDEYQRLWHHAEAKVRALYSALKAADEIRNRNDWEEAYFDMKAITHAALRPESDEPTTPEAQRIRDLFRSLGLREQR